MENSNILYSVVIPVYNSEKIVATTVSEIIAFFQNNTLNYEIILVNDCSKDKSWEVIKDLARKNKNVISINLLKNYGQHTAVFCGFGYAKGNYIITMDDDLQNPPEEIAKLIEKIKEGYDAVIGAQENKQDKIYKNIGSFFVRYLNTIIFNKPKSLKLSSFRIITRAVADEIRVLKTVYPYISGMLLSLTGNISNVMVRHDIRKYGSSTYNLRRLIKLSFNLIINYSSLPLKFMTLIGILVSGASFCIGLFFILKKILVGIPVPGWTSVIFLLSFFNGLLLIILSIIGEYLARIINEVSNYQQFVIREKHI